MAENTSSNNTAIVALSILGLATVAGVFIYFQGGFGESTVVHEQTIIEKVVPAAATPEPTPDPGYKFEHEDNDGNKTVIEAP
jgi:hypothetical protein